MKKIFLTTGILSVLTTPALADINWFVGGGAGYAIPIFTETLNDLIDELDARDNSGTASFNLTAGMRFGEFDKIYNGGVSATYSYMPDVGRLSANFFDYYEDYYGGKFNLAIDGSITMDLSTFYISYDNYIRLSGNSTYRTDFIISFGLGMGWLKENLTAQYKFIDLDKTESSYSSFEDDGMLSVLKIGIGGTKAQGIGWYATLNLTALNAENDADMQGTIGFDIGAKYTF